ncbi:hypothetical protein CSB89_5283 [Pseudomonas aeruginosa]|nr:hypothetical protein CSB89_5283 [Pseudomonas aeruginosa]
MAARHDAVFQAFAPDFQGAKQVREIHGWRPSCCSRGALQKQDMNLPSVKNQLVFLKSTG